MACDLDDNERGLMRHALGLTNSKTSYRNAFVCGEDHDDFNAWEVLAYRGLARKRRYSLNQASVEFVFHVTPEGEAALKKKTNSNKTRRLCRRCEGK